MKKVLLIMLCGFSFNAYADICYDVNKEVAAKAVDIIKTQTEIYKYCSICEDTKPQEITVQSVKADKSVYVNDEAIDLAHTYYKEGDKYVNLGIASGCIKDGEYNIAAKLDNLPENKLSNKDYKLQAQQQAQDIFDKCVNSVAEEKSVTTADMIQNNIKINDCISSAIENEIKQGFNEQQQISMLKYLGQVREGVLNFYSEIYGANKYCYGQCGSMSNLLPYSDESIVLRAMLERLLYLNLAKNGY